MEALLHYVWQHRLFSSDVLPLNDGAMLEIIDPGLHNADAGPDFFNAKIKIDGQLWIGNIEIHERSSDWYRHGHETDENYNNVVLHVVGLVDCEVSTQSRRRLPQVVIKVPNELEARFAALMAENDYPRCHTILPAIDPLAVHAWLCALAVERLEQKTERIMDLLRRTSNDWERVFFITLARAFGFGKNTEAFELWASTLDPQHMGKHRDNPLLIEALFFGQAGLLEDEAVQPENRDSHFRELQREYHFLRQKFVISPIPSNTWRFLRLRPQNFPHTRLAQFATLYISGRLSLADVRECEEIERIIKILNFSTLPYWETHYTFGKSHPKKPNHIDIRKTHIERKSSDSIANFAESSHKPCLSRGSIELLLINAIIPTLFAYARTHQNEKLAERAFEWLETLAAERNAVIRTWREIGISARHAADSQALLQLKLHYCDRRDCLRCRFGSYFLRSRHS